MSDSGNSYLWILVALVAPIAIIMRLFAWRFDRDRIREDVEGRGGKVLTIVWYSFGRGWLGSGNDRIYDVRYRTSEGKIIRATCKTCMFSGVYWKHPSPDDSSVV